MSDSTPVKNDALWVKDGASVFQRCMQAVLGEALGRCCLVYLDDLVIFSHTAEEHEEHVRTE